MASHSAHDVAAEIRHRLPNVPVKKLHKLLYYCQGYHLAAFGEPLYRESLEAWDMGPVVAALWRDEKRTEPAGVAYGQRSALSQGELNTIGYVVARYGQMTGTDLERLTHAEAPWLTAERRRRTGGSQAIDNREVEEFFRGTLEVADPDEEDEPVPTDDTIRKWLAGAHARVGLPASIDDLSDLDSLVRP